MKWPASIILIRHTESEYNVLKVKKKSDSLYQEFVREYEKDPESARTVNLAHEVAGKFALGKSDARTPVASGAEQQAIMTGQRLSDEFNAPHAIYVSPYDRTIKTLECLKKGWPELGGVKEYKDEELREREHGLATLYNDWKVFLLSIRYSAGCMTWTGRIGTAIRRGKTFPMREPGRSGIRQRLSGNIPASA